MPRIPEDDWFHPDQPPRVLDRLEKEGRRWHADMFPGHPFPEYNKCFKHFSFIMYEDMFRSHDQWAACMRNIEAHGGEVLGHSLKQPNRHMMREVVVVIVLPSVVLDNGNCEVDMAHAEDPRIRRNSEKYVVGHNYIYDMVAFATFVPPQQTVGMVIERNHRKYGLLSPNPTPEHTSEGEFDAEFTIDTRNKANRVRGLERYRDQPTPASRGSSMAHPQGNKDIVTTPAPRPSRPGSTAAAEPSARATQFPKRRPKSTSEPLPKRRRAQPDVEVEDEDSDGTDGPAGAQGNDQDTSAATTPQTVDEIPAYIRHRQETFRIPASPLAADQNACELIQHHQSRLDPLRAQHVKEIRPLYLAGVENEELREEEEEKREEEKEQTPPFDIRAYLHQVAKPDATTKLHEFGPPRPQS